MTIHLLRAAALTVAVTAAAAAHADGQRQAEVARRGADVMPFSLAATVHVFTKTREGGVQRVVARGRGDARQARLVREHLGELRARFQRGDFSAPAAIHGPGMPGLDALQAARPGQIAIGYREVPGGAELTYRTADPGLVAALHHWFDAQVSDHGRDAHAGPAHHDGHAGRH